MNKVICSTSSVHVIRSFFLYVELVEISSFRERLLAKTHLFNYLRTVGKCFMIYFLFFLIFSVVSLFVGNCRFILLFCVQKSLHSEISFLR
eukprot:UN15064